eukprot:scaffold8225_cov129-Isochrysis_galbana.AAC.4
MPRRWAREAYRMHRDKTQASPPLRRMMSGSDVCVGGASPAGRARKLSRSNSSRLTASSAFSFETRPAAAADSTRSDGASTCPRLAALLQRRRGALLGERESGSSADGSLSGLSGSNRPPALGSSTVPASSSWQETRCGRRRPSGCPAGRGGRGSGAPPRRRSPSPTPEPGRPAFGASRWRSACGGRSTRPPRPPCAPASLAAGTGHQSPPSAGNRARACRPAWPGPPRSTRPPAATAPPGEHLARPGHVAPAGQHPQPLPGQHGAADHQPVVGQRLQPRVAPPLEQLAERRVGRRVEKQPDGARLLVVLQHQHHRAVQDRLIREQRMRLGEEQAAGLRHGQLVHPVGAVRTVGRRRRRRRRRHQGRWSCVLSRHVGLAIPLDELGSEPAPVVVVGAR